MNGTGPSDTGLRLERLIAAPPERVFALWTEPAQLVRWWGRDDTETLAFDVRHGGAWRATLRGPGGAQHTVSGVYRQIEPPHRLVFTWAWEDESGARGHETEVSVTLTPTPGGTRLVLLQRDFADREARDRHDLGWSSSLDRLARVAA
jgi:uncharacterized protein YndB with AHSA1/START domain